MLAIALAALLAFQSPVPAHASQTYDALAARREADLHNLLVLRLRTLKRGADAESLKTEIVNEIDFATISPRGLEILRRTMALYDKAITSQATLTGKVATLDQADQAARSKSIVTLLTTASTGSLVGLLAGLAGSDAGESASTQRSSLLAQNAASLGSEVSSIEFDLAILRSQIQSEGSVASTDFVLPADYDLFLDSIAKKKEEERTAGVVAALERSPRLQPAVLFLAVQFGTAGDTAQCTRYADRVIDASPTILRRDVLRAQALLCKAHMALTARDYKATLQFADMGLKDDPGHIGLLYHRGAAAAFSGDMGAALPDFEKLALLAPREPTVLYDLACCRCVVSKDVEGGWAAFESALRCGFEDIAHAKTDADLGLLRDERKAEFERLTAIQLGLSMEWHMLEADGLVVENQSAFPIVKLDLVVSFSGISSVLNAPPKPWSTDRKFTLDKLGPGEKHRFPGAIDTTRDSLRSIHVVGSGAQGQVDVTKSLAELEGSSKAK